MRISNKILGLIKDDIVSLLYNSNNALFASQIALELRRDKEFVKRLLLELKALNIVDEITKSNKGIKYKERIRWRLRPEVIKAYDASI